MIARMNKSSFNSLDSTVSRIKTALETRSPQAKDLLSGLLTEALLPACALREERFLANLADQLASRKLIGTDAINVARFSDNVSKLIANTQLMPKFLADLAQYEKRWNIPFTEPTNLDKSARRRKVITSVLEKHPLVTKVPKGISPIKPKGVLGFPTALLVDIFNRSSLGTYAAESPAVTGLLEGKPSDFMTLCHVPLWREMISRHAIKIAERICLPNERFDVVLLGDGSGELGSSIAEKLVHEGRKTRLIHIDISKPMLEIQKLKYMAAGLKEDEIVSIQGNLMQCRSLLNQHAKDFTKGFFVLHEIFDDLRTHSVWSDIHGGGEMFVSLSLSGNEIETMGMSSNEPLISNLSSYLPFYRSLNPVMRSFCPEAIILQREMLASMEKGAIYIGDYGWQFINDTFKQSPKSLPYRVYGPKIRESRDYILGFDNACSITADVHPGILHFSEAFGGKVEFLGLQEDFIEQVSPGFKASIPDSLENCRQIFAGEKAVPLREYQEAFSGLHMTSPSMFAGLITKGI